MGIEKSTGAFDDTLTVRSSVIWTDFAKSVFERRKARKGTERESVTIVTSGAVPIPAALSVPFRAFSRRRKISFPA